MQVHNHTHSPGYPYELIATLIESVFFEMRVVHAVEVVEVRNAAGLFEGCTHHFRDGTIRVELKIGPPQAFPEYGHRYRKRAPVYDLEDWREGLITLAAHEAMHVRQMIRGAVRYSEIECERAAFRMLGWFRRNRHRIETTAANRARAAIAA